MPKPIYGKPVSKSTANISLDALVNPVKDIVSRLNSIMEQVQTMHNSPDGIDKAIIMQRIELVIADLRYVTSL